MCKETKNRVEFVGRDLFGNEYNCKYHPNKEVNGTDYEGYATPNQLTFFYDFCIQHYGVGFYYHNNQYEAEFVDEGPVLINKTENEVQGPFVDAMELIETSDVDGKRLIDVMEDLEHVVLH